MVRIETDRSGYGDNPYTGAEIDNEHSLDVRTKVTLEPPMSVKVVLSADYSFQDDAGYVYHFIGQGNPASLPRVVPLGGTAPASPRDTHANSHRTTDARTGASGAR